MLPTQLQLTLWTWKPSLVIVVSLYPGGTGMMKATDLRHLVHIVEWKPHSMPSSSALMSTVHLTASWAFLRAPLLQPSFAVVQHAVKVQQRTTPKAKLAVT